MTRTFVYGDQQFPDPGPQFTTEMVRLHLSAYFPELAQATAEVQEKDGQQVVTFRKQAGRKGTEAGDVLALLHGLPAPDLAPFHLTTELKQLEGAGQLSAEVLSAMQSQIGAAISKLEKHIELCEGVTRRCLQLRPMPSHRLPAGF